MNALIIAGINGYKISYCFNLAPLWSVGSSDMHDYTLFKTVILKTIYDKNRCICF